MSFQDSGRQTPPRIENNLLPPYFSPQHHQTSDINTASLQPPGHGGDSGSEDENMTPNASSSRLDSFSRLEMPPGTQFWGNFSPTPGTRTPLMLECCCGRENCSNLQVFIRNSRSMEEELRLAGEVGQALLQKHEHYQKEMEEFQQALEHQCARAEQEVQELQDLVRELQQDHKNMLREREDSQRDKNELMELVRNLEQTQLSLEGQIDDVLRQKSLVERKNDSLAAAFEANDVRLRELVKELEKRDDEVKRLTANNIKGEHSEEREEDLRRQMEDLKQELTVARKAESAAEARVHNLHSAHEKLKREQNDGLRSKGKLEAVAMLRESNERLRDEFKSSSNNEANTHLITLIKELSSANNKLKSEILEYRELLTESRNEVSTLQNRIEELETASATGYSPYPASYTSTTFAPPFNNKGIPVQVIDEVESNGEESPVTAVFMEEGGDGVSGNIIGTPARPIHARISPSALSSSFGCAASINTFNSMGVDPSVASPAGSLVSTSLLSSSNPVFGELEKYLVKKTKPRGARRPGRGALKKGKKRFVEIGEEGEEELTNNENSESKEAQEENPPMKTAKISKKSGDSDAESDDITFTDESEDEERVTGEETEVAEKEKDQISPNSTINSNVKTTKNNEETTDDSNKNNISTISAQEQNSDNQKRNSVSLLSAGLKKDVAANNVNNNNNTDKQNDNNNNKLNNDEKDKSNKTSSTQKADNNSQNNVNNSTLLSKRKSIPAIPAFKNPKFATLGPKERKQMMEAWRAGVAKEQTTTNSKKGKENNNSIATKTSNNDDDKHEKGESDTDTIKEKTRMNLSSSPIKDFVEEVLVDEANLSAAEAAALANEVEHGLSSRSHTSTATRLSHLMDRLKDTDILALNRRLKRQFDMLELSSLSNNLIENILTDVENLRERFRWVEDLRGNEIEKSSDEKDENIDDYCESEITKISGSKNRDIFRFSPEEFLPLTHLMQDLLAEVGNLRMMVNEVQVSYVQKVEESRRKAEEEFGKSLTSGRKDYESLERKDKRKNRQSQGNESGFGAYLSRVFGGVKEVQSPPNSARHHTRRMSVDFSHDRDVSIGSIDTFAEESYYPDRNLEAFTSASGSHSAPNTLRIKNRRESMESVGSIFRRGVASFFGGGGTTTDNTIANVPVTVYETKEEEIEKTGTYMERESGRRKLEDTLTLLGRNNNSEYRQKKRANDYGDNNNHVIGGGGGNSGAPMVKLTSSSSITKKNSDGSPKSTSVLLSSPPPPPKLTTTPRQIRTSPSNSNLENRLRQHLATAAVVSPSSSSKNPSSTAAGVSGDRKTMGKTKKSRSSNPLISSSSPSDDRIDLTQLLTSSAKAPSDDDVLQLLSARYKADLPYTRINASTLVVVNPHKPLECMNDVTAKDYAEQWYKDTSGNKPSLQPHVYELAARVYLHMRRSAEDQSVVFSGISGSGKTATQSHLLQQLLLLSTHTKKESKIASLIQNAQFILEAFGNAHTIQNRNASRFGKYLELQFNERGRIIGAKALTYALDKSRVTEVPQDERSYHVFYYLLAGANVEEKSQLHLQDPHHYSYLSQSKCFHISDVDDTIRMDDLRASLKALGFKSKTVSQIWQLLSAILLLGNIEFVNPGRNARDEAASIKNHHVLDLVAEQLGVPSSKLEQTLTYKTKYLRKELCTVFLNAEAATEQRDSLARALYSILFTWIVEHINSKLCNSDEPPNFIGLLDQPGYQNFTKNSFEQFCLNVASEEIENFVLKNIFDDSIGDNAEVNRDGVSLPRVLTMDNSGCVELLRGDNFITSTKSESKKTGLVSILDQESSSTQNGDDTKLLSTLQATFGSHPSYVANPPSSKFSKAGSFGINHFAGQVNYSIDNFIDKNLDNLSTDFVNLFRDTNNPFVSKLFSGPALAIKNHPKNEKTIVMAQLPTKPMRAPSMKKKKTGQEIGRATPAEEEKQSGSGKKKHSVEVSTVITQLYGTLNQLIETMNETRMWNIIQIRPNDNHEPNSFDNKRVKAQIRSFLIPDIVNRKRVDYTVHYLYADFIARYESIIPLNSSPNDRQKVEAFVTSSGWGVSDIALGRQNIFLSDLIWKELEDKLRAAEKEERAKAKQMKDDESLASGFNGGAERPRGLAAASAASSMDRLIPTQRLAYGSDFNDDQSYAGSEDEYYSRSGGNVYNEEEETSMWGSQWGGNSGDGVSRGGDLKQVDEKGVADNEDIEEIPITKTRIWWVRFVWLMTWWIPSFCLSWIGGMKRPDVRMAWREKLVLCMLIFLLSAIIIFYIIAFGKIICPGDDKVYNEREVSFHTGDNDFWVSLRGKIYDISDFWQLDHSDISGRPAADQQMQDFAGTDVTPFFPIPISEACQGLNLNDKDNIIKLQVNSTNASPFGFKHEYPSRIYPTSKLAKADWYTGLFIPRMKRFYKGDLVWDKNDIADQAKTQNRKWAIINKRVYDLSDYFSTQKSNQQQNRPEGNAPIPIPNYHYLDNDVETLFNSLPGQDISSYWSHIDPTTRAYNLACMENLFYVGRIDFRKTFRCQFNNYILLAVSVILMSVVLIKFLAALQLGARRKPEDHDKFVICQVPCYTEGEDSLKRTMDSLAALVYDDKRKLLFLIADGMIIGSGNDRPTPRIVLDILGVDPKMDPEPLAFKSVGEGSAQLNYGKVYSGLYEYEGHVVPYIVVVKVGKPSEVSRPGNRGKRDSQIILMGFLNKVHFDLEMTPLELEIYHQMKNVIGVNPTFYEYILMVDADTEVLPDSLNRMVSCMLHDGRIIGICGETTLTDEEGSWTTMIQVYEYYISHHLAKAFESLFGSVTCLPGCFCMYRIRTPTKGTPLIISKTVIDDYSENHVDTLHKKNLLSLGEDRYLTTLMMKHFSQYKMTFTPDAQCRTAAPDRWGILLSQRRRWINSTIHNLMELMFLPEMCGFCCFSMRFVVFIDLFGTLILPSTVIYIIYLIYAVATKKQTLPIIALAMIAAVYGLQAIIFILKRQWQHIGWMIIYLLAFPLFSFFIPIYAFWHFDDFSWGNTRMVVGEKGKKQIINKEEEKFDEKMIPKKKWADYEQEMWEVGTTGSHESRRSAASYHSSQHNYETGSQYGSQYGGSQYGGGDYYRDTNLAVTHGRRNRSHSPVPKYSTSDYRASRAYSNVGGDHVSEPRSSMLLSRDLETVASRPISSYSSPADGPTDEEILMEIRNILANANLMNITKKQVREQLTEVFGVDMTSRKEFINNSIELTLQGKL
ncbi:848_t:CDS:10 [Ambispora gerdemannii]|uniref:chitin synthase n=1 Tax=Ambispora gerdemannii TaxID=144530 RepID=A0A9N8VMT3_9GLOM|nr:848_t:CDS:10 [Ambispora gerdemannii]